VEQPRTSELVVNARAAKALGITIPPSVVARADRVIE
jgi:putative ABC transport system substrate-binding protein